MGGLISSSADARMAGAELRRIAEDYGEFNIVVVEVPGADSELLAQRLAETYGADFVTRSAAHQDADDSASLRTASRALLAAACQADLDAMAAALAARANQEIRLYSGLRRGARRVRVFAHSYAEERYVMLKYAAAMAAAAQPGGSSRRGGSAAEQQLRVLNSLNYSVQSVARQAVPPHLTLWVYARHTERAWADVLRAQPPATHSTLNSLRRLLDQELSVSVGPFFAAHNSACIVADTEHLSATATVADVAQLVERFAVWLRDQGLLLPREQATLPRSIATDAYLQQRHMVCTSEAVQRVARHSADAAAAPK